MAEDVMWHDVTTQIRSHIEYLTQIYHIVLLTL